MIQYKSVARLYKQQNIYICFQQTQGQQQTNTLNVISTSAEYICLLLLLRSVIP